MVLPLPATPVGDAYQASKEKATDLPTFPMDVYFCKKCGLIQLLDVVSPSLLYGHFTYETSISLGLPQHFVNYAKEVSETVKLAPGSRVIDIGSNDGTLLQAFKNLGYSVLGVDTAVTIAERATSRGIPTIGKLFTSRLAKELVESHGKFSLIVSNNTIANIDDLDDFISGVKELLDDNGTFVLETGYGPDVFHEGLFDTIYHEHISYFSIRSFQHFADRLELVVTDAKRVPTKGGSIRCYLTRKSANRTPSNAIKEILAYEEKVGANDENVLLELQSRIQTARRELHTVLAELKAEGKKIGGYGASVGTTTFNYTMGLKELIDYMVDDNKVKFNMFSPGHGIEVRSSDVLYADKPDAVVILAWRYAEPILKKHQRYVDEGGEFILPWTKLQRIKR